jgi:hypothetical protein
MPKTKINKPLNVYGTTRQSLALSRAEVVALVLRAGHKISASGLTKLEEAVPNSSGILISTIEDKKNGTTKEIETVGSRGLSEDTVAYLDYLYGLGTFDSPDFSEVERGAPVLVVGEAGQWSYSSTNEDGSVQVFGGKGNVASFRSFAPEKVRIVAMTALPSEDQASLFASSKRGPRGSNGASGSEILSYFDKHAGMAHAVGAVAYALGLDNAVASRALAALETKGELAKVGRGVYIRSNEKPIGAEPSGSAEAMPEF